MQGLNQRPIAPPHAVLHPGVQPQQAPALSRADRNLFEAVRCANEADFTELMWMAIEEGANINAIDEEGRSLLEMAVTRDSPRIVQALLARNAPLPRVLPNGVDLLMRAAENGNAAMVTVLVDIGCMSVDETDASGQSALHYAVKSGSFSTVQALLSRGTDCDEAAAAMSAAELITLFGTRHQLADIGITPLMIAVAKSDLPLTTLLLEHSDTSVGDLRRLLQIAISANDVAMLDVVLAHCEVMKQLSDVVDQGILEHTLVATESTQMLRLLLSYHRKQPMDDLEVDTALLTAVNLGHVDQVAVLMAAGAEPEQADDTDRAIWLAAAGQPDSTLSDLLTASRAADFHYRIQHDPMGTLFDLSGLAHDTVELGAHGVFAAVINPVLPELTKLSRNTDRQTSTQKANATACALSGYYSAASNQAVSNAQQPPLNTVPQHFQAHKISQAKLQQQDCLRKLSSDTVNKMIHALSDALSPGFLMTMRTAHEFEDDGRDLKALMCAYMREVHGFPDTVAYLVSAAWAEAEAAITAAEIHSSSGTANSSAQGEADANAVSRLTAHLLFVKLEALGPVEEGLLAVCKTELLRQLSAQRIALRSLVNEPAAFLRMLEQRQGLRPVNAQALSTALIRATGLPASTCATIVSFWQQSVAQVNREPQTFQAADRFQQLDRIFADHWRGWLEQHDRRGSISGQRNSSSTASSASDTLPLTPDELQRALSWCEAAQDAALGQHKRRARGEAPDAPPAKPPRLN